ncbi:hypothetical protein PU634_05180 [Oceanimonas pelagia]|uniref:Uncharacterized protein n=1 Tax=Oceanimonas pelagia TaxID=3028314 RepID=A0AA50KP25_9GAMM|nr:hypothetical protein [Oceanimonas pelagia]WMC11761.1 hypothetical protein PU634_05180 [Oceanimonas pelagia]
MTVSNKSYLKGYYDRTKALGRKVVNSDFTLEIEGFEGMFLLAPQCPWPVTTVAGEISVPTPLGVEAWEPQQVKAAKQGQVRFMETVDAPIDQMLVELITQGGTFNAKIYEGTPEKHLRYKRIIDAFIQVDDADRDWENRSQLLTFSGTMFYHYYGEVVNGNSADYR